MAKKATSKELRGQGTKCKGLLTITLSGPQGSGKSLVFKVLAALLPLLMVDRVKLVQAGDEQDELNYRSGE